MAIQLDVTSRNAVGDSITAQLGATPVLRFYSGTAPATVGTALSGNTLLAELPCSATPAPAAASGVVTFSAITTTNAVATGTASFFRIYKSDGTTAKIQGTVAVSGGDINLNTVSIVSGGPVAESSLTLTMPGA